MASAAAPRLGTASCFHVFTICIPACPSAQDCNPHQVDLVTLLAPQRCTMVGDDDQVWVAAAGAGGCTSVSRAGKPLLGCGCGGLVQLHREAGTQGAGGACLNVTRNTMLLAFSSLHPTRAVHLQLHGCHSPSVRDLPPSVSARRRHSQSTVSGQPAQPSKPCMAPSRWRWALHHHALFLGTACHDVVMEQLAPAIATVCHAEAEWLAPTWLAPLLLFSGLSCPMDEGSGAGAQLSLRPSNPGSGQRPAGCVVLQGSAGFGDAAAAACPDAGADSSRAVTSWRLVLSHLRCRQCGQWEAAHAHPGCIRRAGRPHQLW